MSRFFINRPIVAIVIAVLMTIIGGVCILGLPIAQFPNIVPPEIQVKTHYTGADAQTIEQSVAAPIEQQMSGVDNMNYMYSVNANNGDMTLRVNFDVATDPNIARYPYSALRSTGVTHRHIHALSRVRILDQYAIALWPGVGHWSGG